MISDAPAEAADRAVPGHWEGDLIIGKDCSQPSAPWSSAPPATSCCCTCRTAAMPTWSSRPCGRRSPPCPPSSARTITWDQGTEMAYHAQFTIATGIPVYFCDPHAPWQRGSNENTNGLLRQYLPKGTDLSVHSAAGLAHIATSLNNRPRKTLGFMKPSEKLTELGLT